MDSPAAWREALLWAEVRARTAEGRVWIAVDTRGEQHPSVGHARRYLAGIYLQCAIARAGLAAAERGR